MEKEKQKFEKMLKTLKEGYQIEFKESRDLPKSFWETYSSFSNTEGGLVFLGVKESKEGNIIYGINNPDRVITNLWNEVSNKNKVSFRSINNEHISILECEGKKVILVEIPEVPNTKKPVYINNKLDMTYIRTNDGDRLASKDEIAALLRNASPDSDSLSIDNYSLNDLDMYSVISFKEKVSLRYPNKRYMEMDNKDFLLEIGACSIDRRTNELKIKRGTLLFLGKYNSIKELYPHYHLDYFNRKGSNSRWIDRVSDDDPNELEMNIYNFFNIVLDKLQNVIMDSFNLKDSQERDSNHGFDSSIREALINCLAHADYDQNYPSIKIQVLDGLFIFKNPGELLIPKKQFVIGGDSRPRNEIIMKLFRLLGFSERQGFGGPQIYKSANENSYRSPELETNINFTELKIWSVDLADSYPDLSNDEKDILKLIIKKKLITRNEILSYTKLSDYYVRKSLDTLKEKSLIETIGKGRATKYCLNTNRQEIITQLQMTVDFLKQMM